MRGCCRDRKGHTQRMLLRKWRNKTRKWDQARRATPTVCFLRRAECRFHASYFGSREQQDSNDNQSRSR